MRFIKQIFPRADAVREIRMLIYDAPIRSVVVFVRYYYEGPDRAVFQENNCGLIYVSDLKPDFIAAIRVSRPANALHQPERTSKFRYSTTVVQIIMVDRHSNGDRVYPTLYTPFSFLFFILYIYIRSYF